MIGILERTIFIWL